MKYLALFFWIFALSYISSSQEILWWFDLKDSAFGQASAGDIDNDGKLEIVFGCYRNDSCVYAINGEDGSLLWKYNTSSGNAEGCNDVATLIYDVDNDGSQEVIVPSSCNPKTFCFNGGLGSIRWTTPTKGSDSPPTIADIDGDGELEILHGEFLGYVICINAKTGTAKWEIQVQPNTWIQTAPSLVDIDGDGLLDFVVATWCLSKSDTNRIYAFRGYDQTLLWKQDIGATVYHGTSAADIDNDGKLELIFGDYSGTLYVLNSESGVTKWAHTDKNWFYIGSPISIADLDGDGFCELVFSTAYHIVAMKNNGQALWARQLSLDNPSFRGVALSDLDNDNLPDIVFGTNKGKLIVLKGTSGEEICSLDLRSHIGKEFSIDHCPLVADFNQDGKLDAFIVGGKTDYPDFSKNYGRAYLISLERGNGPDWLMFQNNPHRTGSLCEVPNTKQNENKRNDSFTIQVDQLDKTLEIEFNEIPFYLLEICVFDAFGRKVISSKDYLEKSLLDKIYKIDIDNLTSGIYFVRINLENHFETKAFSLIK